MSSDNYKQALEQAHEDLRNAIRERDRLGLEIVKLEQLVKSLSQMVPADAKDRAEFETLEAALGFTEIVDTIIRSSITPMSPVGIRNKLLEMGYDISGYSNPLGFVHTVIGRLEKQGKIRETEPNVSGLYVTKNSLYDALLAIPKTTAHTDLTPTYNLSPKRRIDLGEPPTREEVAKKVDAIKKARGK
jgi:hypothetical protein